MDPKFFVGISDNTILHLSLWKHCRQVGLHGALYPDEATGDIGEATSSSLRSALMGAPWVLDTASRTLTFED
jgi:muramoyltetrapeptide carboxypeptidase